MTLQLPKLLDKSSLMRPGVSYKQKLVFRDNHGQNIWDEL